jgi:hypothetical protein
VVARGKGERGGFTRPSYSALFNAAASSEFRRKPVLSNLGVTSRCKSHQDARSGQVSGQQPDLSLSSVAVTVYCILVLMRRDCGHPFIQEGT